MKDTSPLILGGHSFISQLGNDPAASFDQQLAIINTCLDNGINTFDTTYQPERVALGRILKELDRRDEAEIIAWNFFTDFDPGDDVGPADYYQPQYLEVMPEQLQTTFIDRLVVHRIGESPENDRQEQLAIDWQMEGYIGDLGVWHSGENPAEEYPLHDRYSFMVRPYNIARVDDAPGAFAAAKGIGWQTLACSPFIRGWRLDTMVKNAMAQSGESEDDLRVKLADWMLRFSLFQPNVDRLITAIRRPQWVLANLESVRRGVLSGAEVEYLLGLQGDIDG